MYMLDSCSNIWENIWYSIYEDGLFRQKTPYKIIVLLLHATLQ